MSTNKNGENIAFLFSEKNLQFYCQLNILTHDDDLLNNICRAYHIIQTTSLFHLQLYNTVFLNRCAVSFLQLCHKTVNLIVLLLMLYGKMKNTHISKLLIDVFFQIFLVLGVLPIFVSPSSVTLILKG